MRTTQSDLESESSQNRKSSQGYAVDQRISVVSDNTACKGVQVLALLAPGRRYGARRSPLSEYMSLHLSLRLTTNCVPVENKMRDIFL